MSQGLFIQVSEIGQALMAFYVTIKMSPWNVLIGRDFCSVDIVLCLYLASCYDYIYIHSQQSCKIQNQCIKPSIVSINQQETCGEKHLESKPICRSFKNNLRNKPKQGGKRLE